LDTPRRFAASWRDFIEYNAGNEATVFNSFSVNQMVVVKGMRVWSMCEHHLLPFYCDVSIGYIADNKILGLSKFGRIAKKNSHRLQVQERLVENIASDIMKITASENVAVIARGEHLCMTMRGIEMPATMISSSLHGVFRDAPSARLEFLELIK
jgi:GTP cyclohydrolase I